MKVKNLLTVACLAASLSASASYPLFFRDSGLDGADMQYDADGKPLWNGGGHFDYPVEEGTRVDVPEEGKKISYGTPLFAEDGSITLTRQNYDGGSWFRTKKLTEACPKEYTVFAMDYKCNRDVNDLVLWQQEGWPNHIHMFNGALFTVSDEYQTVYAVINREQVPEWGDDTHFAQSYFWVNWNTVTPGWELTVKNIRLLTLDEATEECKSSGASVVNDAFGQANLSFSKDFDPDMNEFVYAWAPENDGNSVLTTGQMAKPLPTGVTTFAFDYKVSGTDCQAAIWMMPVNASGALTTVNLEACGEDEDPYEAEWKTATVDLKDAIAQYNFAQTFGSNHYLWLQFRPNLGFSADNMMWLRNPRWINPEAQSGVAELGVAERPADNRVFNLMGVEVKGELTPGLYIRNGKKFIVK